jgi:uncharacterized protein (DUF2252 family)
VENFGTFKGDNGLVYFDLNDFDDAMLAPLTVDVIRMLSSVLVAGESIGLSEADARTACAQMLSVYTAMLRGQAALAGTCDGERSGGHAAAAGQAPQARRAAERARRCVAGGGV